MIAFARQENQHYCFLACLESFLAEQGQLVSQEDIRKKTSDIFGAHPNDLGAFSPQYFGRVAEAWDLEVTAVDTAVGSVVRTESIFALCHWEGDPQQAHWVRFLHADGVYAYLMDPGYEHCPRKIELTKFSLWWKVLFSVKTKNA